MDNKTLSNFGNIFEYKNTYCRLIKDNIVPISNFIINPLHIIEGEDENEITSEILCKDGTSFKRNIDLDTFSDVTSFRKSLNSLKLSFAGSVDQLQYIKSIIASKPYEHIKGVRSTGFHRIDGIDCFLASGSAVDKYMNPFLGVALLNGYEELSTDILNTYSISKEELRSISKSLFNFNKLGITSTLMGYICGSFLKGKLLENNIKYSHLIIEGQSGSGKSETLENIIVPIFSINKPPMNASECTPFALNRAASSSNFIPLILDEYKPSKMSINRIAAISNIMRNSYDHHTSIKGVSSLKKNKEFKAEASLILCGKGGIDETANIERSLRVIFSPSFHTADREAHIKNLKSNKNLLKKLGKSLLTLSMRMDNETLINAYNKLQESIPEDIIKNSRVKNSIVNASLGIVLIKSLFKSHNLDFDSSIGYSLKEIKNAIVENAKVDLLDEGSGSKSVIDYTLETINRMAINELIKKDYDYGITVDKDKNKILKLNYLSFYDKFLKYCKEHCIEHEVLPLSSFKKQISKTHYCLSFNKPTLFKVNSGYINDYKTFRAAILDVDLLRKQNIDLDYILGEK